MGDAPVIALLATLLATTPIQVVVQGVAAPPEIGAKYAAVIKITVDSDPSGTVSELSIRAANKRGDPPALIVLDAETHAVLGRMPMVVKAGNKPRYTLDRAFALPAGGIHLAARTNENWARLASRRKLSRTVDFTLVGPDGLALAQSIVAKKRPMGTDHLARADDDPATLKQTFAALVETEEPGTWRLPAGTYSVTSDVVVPRRMTLRLDPGVTIELGVARSLVVFGRLMATGTTATPVTFKAMADGAFGSISFQGSRSAGSHLTGCRFIGGSQTFSGKHDVFGMVDVRKSAIRIDDSSFEDTRGEDALHVTEGRLEVRRCRVSNTASDGIDFDQASGFIEDSTFVDIADDAIDIGESQVVIRRVRVEKAGGKALTAGPRAEIALSDSMFIDAGRGISSFDGSLVAADHVAIVRSIKSAAEAPARDGETQGRVTISYSLLWKNGAPIDHKEPVTLTKTRDDLPIDLANYSPIASGNDVLGPPAFDGAAPVVSADHARAREAKRLATPPVDDPSRYVWWLAGA
ncbi:MAG: hypothetical protein ACI9OJ_004967, partial [Myxococcota bacterium]